MDEQRLGLTHALLPDWRGGICCKVITDGSIAAGDGVVIKKVVKKSEQSELNF
jgi:MOSC domain-containing protein YiiM